MLGDFAAKDGGDLIGLANRTIGIQEALPELIQGGSPAEDQIVTALRTQKANALQFLYVQKALLKLERQRLVNWTIRAKRMLRHGETSPL